MKRIRIAALMTTVVAALFPAAVAAQARPADTVARLPRVGMA